MRIGAIFPKYIRSSDMKAKKFLSVLMALALVFASVAILASCGEKKPTTATVTFDPYYWMEDDDNFEVSNEDDLELERDVEIGSKVGSLPKPKAEGYTFGGWYAEDDEDFEEKYKSTTKIEEDITLVAKWTKDGADSTDTGTSGGDTPTTPTCSHTYGPPTHEEATCTKGGYDEFRCMKCYELKRVYYDDEPALGHQWGSWTDVAMGRNRTCKRCNEEETETYKNITSTSIDGAITMDGEWYGTNGTGPLVNGKWDDEHKATIATKSGACGLIIKLKPNVKADKFYVAGTGSTGYTVLVTYEGESDPVSIGMGSLGSIMAFDLDNTRNISEIRIDIENGTGGVDTWQEVALAVKE